MCDHKGAKPGQRCPECGKTVMKSRSLLERLQKAWDESKRSRKPKGSPGGGQFAAGGSGGEPNIDRLAQANADAEDEADEEQAMQAELDRQAERGKIKRLDSPVGREQHMRQPGESQEDYEGRIEAYQQHADDLKNSDDPQERKDAAHYAKVVRMATKHERAFRAKEAKRLGLKRLGSGKMTPEQERENEGINRREW